MRPPNRSGTGHELLVLAELVAVPAALLVTFFTLTLAELVGAVVGVTNEAVAAGETALTLGNAAVGFGTLLVLVAGGGSLVVGYRRCFVSWFDDVDPLRVLLVPVLGVVVPIGYSFVTTGSVGLSSWLFLPVVISAHALAYRTIAIDSLREDRGRTSFVVGALTAFPGVAVLVDIASGVLGSERPIARTLDAVVAGPEVPMVRTVVVAVPLCITLCYGIGTLYSRQSWWDGPDWTMPRLDLERSLSRPSVDWSIPRLYSPISDRLSRDRTDPSGRQSTGAARTASRSKRRSRAPSDVVPSSPGSASAGRSESSSDDGDDASPSSEPGESSGETSSGDDRSASDRRGDAGGAEAPSAEPAVADSSTDGTASDTRIFTDDFDQYGPDESPVETCPDCEEEIPSDGVYNFCPFCGGDL